jgi:alpha-1,2-mannosyltransferase
MLNLRPILEAARSGRWITAERIRVYPNIFLAISLAGLVWLAASPIGPRWSGSDFVGFWVPANLAAAGHATAIYDQRLFAMLQQAISGGSDTYLPWIYPPTFLLLIMPLGALSYKTAFVVWMTAALTVYWLALRRLAGRETLIVALAFPGVMICIYNGHAEILLAGLLGGAMFFLDRRPYVAGLLIGLCAVKPHLFLLVPVALVAAIRWRPMVSAACLVLLSAAISAAVFGADLWRDFFMTVSDLGDGAVRNSGSLGIVLAKQQSVLAFGLRFGTPILALSLQVAVMALAGWAVAITWARNRSLGERSMVLCCGTLLASPYLFDYDLVLLAVPIAIVAREGLANGFPPWQKSLLSALWLTPALARACSYYVDLPATVILLGLSIAIYTVRPGRIEDDSRSDELESSQEAPAPITA